MAITPHKGAKTLPAVAVKVLGSDDAQALGNAEQYLRTS